MLAATIGTAIRDARKDQRLSRAELARRSGKCRRLVSELERGECPNVWIETAPQLLSPLGLELTALTRARDEGEEARAARREHARAIGNANAAPSADFRDFIEVLAARYVDIVLDGGCAARTSGVIRSTADIGAGAIWTAAGGVAALSAVRGVALSCVAREAIGGGSEGKQVERVERSPQAPARHS